MSKFIPAISLCFLLLVSGCKEVSETKSEPIPEITYSDTAVKPRSKFKQYFFVYLRVVEPKVKIYKNGMNEYGEFEMPTYVAYTDTITYTSDISFVDDYLLNEDQKAYLVDVYEDSLRDTKMKEVDRNYYNLLSYGKYSPDDSASKVKSKVSYRKLMQFTTYNKASEAKRFFNDRK